MHSPLILASTVPVIPAGSAVLIDHVIAGFAASNAPRSVRTFVFVMSRTRSASDGYLQTVRPVVRLTNSTASISTSAEVVLACSN